MLKWAKWIEVDSTNIAKICHNKKTKSLLVVFKRSNEVYCYSNFSTKAFNNLLKSKSIGTYINKYVKKYAVDKLTKKAAASF
jgi:hypothetical protein